MKGPDGLSSWVIAMACFFINMMMFGMTRLSGVLFVASMPRFWVGREDASFPYTFANFVRNTSGPLVGYLGGLLGVRLVTTFGCFLAAVGVGTCFLAENISMVTILWGIIFGLGFGLGNILLPVKINQYFDKKRATASGISFAGASIGSFILPPIVESLLDIYGLSGAFLIMSGLVLNCVPAALLLRKPDFLIQSTKSRNRNGENRGERQSITSGKKVKLYTVEHGSPTIPSNIPKNDRVESLKNGDCSTVPVAYSSLTYEERMKRLSTQTLLSTYSVRMSSPDALNIEQILENSKGRRQVDQSAIDCEVNSLNSNNTDQDSVFGKDNNTNISPESNGKANLTKVSHQPVKRTLSSDSLSPGNKDSIAYQFSKSYDELYETTSHLKQNGEDFTKYVTYVHQASNYPTVVPKSKSVWDSFSIVYDPIFLLVAITNALYSSTFVCMITVIVDFARDIDVGLSNEKYILMSLSVGDLMGRLCLGWITDGGYMTRAGFAALCFLCQGITTAAIAWSTGFPMLVSFAALYGLSESGLILIYPLIVAEYIEEDKQTVAISSSCFLAGPLCLAVAPLIGYFRDEIGSYEYIFSGIGIISALCCIAWLLTPCILKCRRKTEQD